MAYKNLKEFLIFIVLVLFVNRVVNGQQFIPEHRVGHTATLLGNKVYYIGGYYSNFGSLSDFFYLNIDNIDDLSWVDLKSRGVRLPLTAWHTSDIGGANQDSIFIIGGIQLETTNLVYRFDTKTNEVTTPIIQEKEPPRRRDMRSVRSAGKIYIFSGRIFDSTSNSSIFYNNFDILDTVNMTWNVGSLVNAPTPRYYYTATLFNGVIYYIGGIRQDQSSTAGQIHVPMANISQYNITEGTWSLKIATAIGGMLGVRTGHSAVLVDNEIWIYGGINGPFNVPSTNQIAMLNTNSLVWSIPTLSNPNIPNLVFHTATQFGIIMLLAFGDLTDVSVGGVVNNDFYIFYLDNLNVTWYRVTAREFAQPKQQPQPTPPPLPKSPTSTPTGVIVGLSISLVIAGIVAFSLVYRYRKKKMKNENVSAADHPGGGDITYSPKFAPTTLQYQYSNSQEELAL